MVIRARTRREGQNAYEAEMEQQAKRVGELQEQMNRLEEAVKDLKEQVELLAEDYREIAAVLSGG